MRVRPIDENGDMMPVWSDSQMLEGSKAVAQIARDRLMLYRGDWWENEDLGVYIPHMFTEKISQNNVYFIEKFLTSYLSKTEGVKGVSGVTASLANHTLQYRATLRTSEGKEQVEVDMSGIL